MRLFKLKPCEVIDTTPLPTITQPVIEILRLMEENPFCFYQIKSSFIAPGLYQKTCSYSDGKIHFSLKIQLVCAYPYLGKYCIITLPIGYGNDFEIIDSTENDLLSLSFDEVKNIHDEYDRKIRRKRVCDYLGVNNKERRFK